MRRDLVSIIVPVYNTAGELPQCVDSLLAQSLDSLEILLVNDGSTDESGALCDAFARKDPRVRALHQRNGGVSAARNEGMRAATGEYIAFVDSDDCIDAQMMEALLIEIKRTGADIAVCGFVEQKANDVRHARAARTVGVVGALDAASLSLRDRGFFTAVWNKLYRADALRDAGGAYIEFDTDIAVAEDELWLLKVLLRARDIAIMDRLLYTWRWRSGSALRSVHIDQRRMSVLRAMERAEETLKRDASQLTDLYRAHFFDSCFDLMVDAYLRGDRENARRVRDTIAERHACWQRSKDVSLQRKLRMEAILLLMRAGAGNGPVSFFARMKREA